MIKKSLTSLKNNKLLRYALFAVVAIVFVLLIVLVTRKKPVAEKAEMLPTVVLQKPVNGTLVESVTISGYVEANAMIPVVPFVSGTITDYPARAGDFVEKDTLLAKIDDEPFRQQMLQVLWRDARQLKGVLMRDPHRFVQQTVVMRMPVVQAVAEHTPLQHFQTEHSAPGFVHLAPFECYAVSRCHTSSMRSNVWVICYVPDVGAIL